MRIWVDVAKEHEKYLWNTMPYKTYIEEAIDSIVVRLANWAVIDSTN